MMAQRYCRYLEERWLTSIMELIQERRGILRNGHHEQGKSKA